jgi:hypothetical protein
MNKVTKSSLVQDTEGYKLLVDGVPFYINGAGLEFASIQALAEHGANSFRTWRVNNGQQSGQEVLDEAQKYGLKVMMGIEVASERHGFDYDNKVAVAKQLQQIKKDVLELKDHPALILWGIGNELNLHSTNPKVWDAVNDISKMIHEEDPNHLTTTSLAGMDEALVKEINKRASDMDILSVQLYGELVDLPGLIKVVGWKGPIIVSEWGAVGYWEVEKTKWGAPIEENSSVKADGFMERYTSSIKPLTEQCLGSYVFLWGQKQERTSTWFGFFTEDGRKTEVVDVMHCIWNGGWPNLGCPRIVSHTLNKKRAKDSIKLKAGNTYQASIQVSGSGDFTYRWEVLRESESTKSGGDAEDVPETITGSIVSNLGPKAEMLAPKEKGAYRLYIYVDDQASHTAHSNIPFLVE